MESLIALFFVTLLDISAVLAEATRLSHCYYCLDADNCCIISV